jgi:hypothetical protein
MNNSLSVFTETVDILRRMAQPGSVEEVALRDDLVGMQKIRLFARPPRRDQIAVTEAAAGVLAKALRARYGEKLAVIVTIGAPLDERFGS